VTTTVLPLPPPPCVWLRKLGTSSSWTALIGGTATRPEGRRTGEFSVADTDGALLAISSLCVDVCRWFPSRTHRDPERLAELYTEIALRIVT
jgi:hypothetical protein